MPGSIELKLKSVYPLLRPSEKKAAEYILNNKHNLKKMSLRELSEKSGVSQPTVMRALKTAGFDGYKAFKHSLYIKNSEEEEKKNNIIETTNLNPWDTMEKLAAKTTATAIYMLDETLKASNLKNLKKAVEIISHSQCVGVYGVENSYAAVIDLVNKLTYLGIKCMSFQDSYLQRVSAYNLDEKDAAVCISLSGTSEDTVEAIKNAKRSGANTIAITNNENSAVCKYADTILPTGNSDMVIYGGAMFSRVTQLAINNMLYMGIILTDYERYSKRLDRREKLIERKQIL
ncbi:MAG TPA: MurR/RpiR family transcriptional regulator [Firmicutes bacterium]|nr:MurR/RpiR family transcriptional regulator [Bacillota bacterium]